MWLSLTVHEAAHAWTADRLGDPTARLLGRISLNPLVHLDPIGTVLLPLVAIWTGAPLIGWAKPVPVNAARLRHPRRDLVMVIAAGPASNLAMAFLASLAYKGFASPPDGSQTLVMMAALLMQVNLMLALFNLVPVPPLDGGNMLGTILGGKLARGFDTLRPYGTFILYALLLSGALDYLIGPPYVFLSRWLSL